MSKALQKRVSAGTQFSWLAIVSPLISIVSLVLLATVLPLRASDGETTVTADGGYTKTYELGFAASFTSTLVWLFLALAVVAGVLTFALRSGRQKMNLVRATIGLVLVAGIVGRIVINQA